MDVARPDRAKVKRIRRLSLGAAALAVASLIGVAVVRLEPAPTGVDRASVWVDTVKRGVMLRDVRGQGALVSEDLLWIPAATTGRVDRIVLRPGTPVRADSVIVPATVSDLAGMVATAMKVFGSVPPAAPPRAAGTPAR